MHDVVRVAAHRLLGGWQRHHARLVAMPVRLRRRFRQGSTARSEAPRVIATACWHFPIYSQSFVYQELAAMIAAGFDVTFLYSGESGQAVAPQFAAIARASRRVHLSREAGRADLAHYRRRLPTRVADVLAQLSRASGHSVDSLESHEHILHAFAFTRVVEAMAADYLHSYFFYERSLFTFVASQLLDLPRGVSCYADHVLDDYALKVVGLQLREADVVVATSRRIGEELEACAGRPLPQAIVKYNAVDTSRFAPRDRHTVAPDGRARLVAVNRLDPKKGLEYLVEAMACLRERGIAAELELLGDADEHDPSGRAYRERLEAAIETSGLRELVRLRGGQPADAVRDALARADVFVAPYVELPNGDKDGIPTALLEAMAAGCAVVVTHAGSIAEVVEHETDGLVVPQRDARAIADAVERLLADDALRARLAETAARRARRQFDIADVERPLHQRVRDVVVSARTRRGPGT